MVRAPHPLGARIRPQDAFRPDSLVRRPSRATLGLVRGVRRLRRQRDHVLLLRGRWLDSSLRRGCVWRRTDRKRARNILGGIHLLGLASGDTRSDARLGRRSRGPRRRGDRTGRQDPDAHIDRAGGDPGGSRPLAAGRRRRDRLSLFGGLGCPDQCQDLDRSLDAERLGHRRGLGLGAVLCRLSARARGHGAERLLAASGQQSDFPTGGGHDLLHGLLGSAAPARAGSDGSVRAARPGGAGAGGQRRRDLFGRIDAGELCSPRETPESRSSGCPSCLGGSPGGGC